MTLEQDFQQMAIDSIKRSVCPQIEESSQVINRIRDQQRAEELFIPELHPLIQPPVHFFLSILHRLRDKPALDGHLYTIDRLNSLLEKK